MDFSIIIPTCNRNELLGKCLDKLAPGRQKGVPVNFEVIVTDDSEGEGAENFCKENFPWARYLRGPRKGPAANRNHGAFKAKAQWLIFLDDDCIPDEGLVAAYATARQNNPDGRVFEGAIHPLGKQTAFNQECPVNTEGGNLWSCNFCISAILFEDKGGFDEGFPYPAMEDMDLHLRLKMTETVLFVPGAQVWHPWRKVSDPKKRFQQSLQSLRYYLEKWPKERGYFTPGIQWKKICHHAAFRMLPGVLVYRGRGLGYIFAYYRFLWMAGRVISY
jgi:GT2 family glycosyltransferase